MGGLKLLITGSAGFIGSHAVRYFGERDFQVRGVDLQARRQEDRVDLSDERSVSRLVRREAPEGILHLGAFASVPGCERDPEKCVRDNILGTLNVARAVAASGSRMVFASSAAVYGDRAPVPTPVRASPEPTNFYGISKLAGEKICRDYASDSVSLRLFNVYGEGCRRSYVIPDTIRKLSSHPKVLAMEGTGTEERDFVYIADVLRSMEISLRGHFRGTYNVGTGRRTSIRSLIRTIAGLVGQPRVPLSFVGPRAGDFRVSLADISGPNRVPGWRPKVSLSEGLGRILAAG